MEAKQRPIEVAPDGHVYPQYTPIDPITKDTDPLYEGPRVVHTNEDTGVETVVPNLPYEWWVDTHGNPVALVVSTNRNPREEYETRYGDLERRRRRELGWKPFSEFSSAEERTAYMKKLQAAQHEKTKGYVNQTKSAGELFGDNAAKALDRHLDQIEKRMAKAEKVKGG